MEEIGETGDVLIGKVFAGKYRVSARIGTGGMSGVYKAEHVLMNRIVALKVLPKQLADDPTSIRRFEAEARIASQISHPNAVTLFDFGVEEKLPYLVMEYIEGSTLRGLLTERKPLPVLEVFRIVEQTCAALGEAHERGIVHRDIKPSNIMLRPSERVNVKVLDFGIAKVVNQAVESSPNITVAGTIVGTPHYMSPEQGLAKELDARSDIYSLGVVIYEMLSGERPFEAPSTLELLMKHVNTPPTSIRELHPELQIPREVEAVVMKCLEKDPGKRYQNANELAEAFRHAVLDGPETLTKGKALVVVPNWITPTLAGVAVILIGVLIVQRAIENHSRENKPAVVVAPTDKKVDPNSVAPVVEKVTPTINLFEVEAARKLEEIKAELERQAELARQAEQERQVAIKEAEEMRAKAAEEAKSREQLEQLQAELTRQAEAAKKAEEERVKALEQAEKIKQAPQEDNSKKVDELQAELARQVENAKRAAAAQEQAKREAESMKRELEDKDRQMKARREMDRRNVVTTTPTEPIVKSTAAALPPVTLEPRTIQPTETTLPKKRKRCGPTWCM